MKNLFNLSVFVCFMILLNGCSSTQRKDLSVPMEQSCIVIIDSWGANLGIWDTDSGFSYDNDEDKKNIVPAGTRNLKGFIAIGHGTGRYYTYQKEYGGGVVRDITGEYVRYEVIRDITGTLDLEPGKFYKVTISRVFVNPAELDGIYADDAGNIYSLKDDKIYYDSNNPDRSYVWKITAKEIEGKMGKTYITSEYGGLINLGIRHPNMFEFTFGPTYGLAFFSDPVNVHIYGEAGLGVGMGVLNYDFAHWEENLRSGLPVVNFGVTSDFDIGKWGMGLGAGYIMGAGILNLGDEPEEIARLNSLYIQLAFGRPHDFSCFFIDYYPGVMPIYSAFGLGMKLRW